MLNNDSQKEKKKLSHRPLKRFVTFQCELGPYYTPTVAGKANNQRAAQSYAVWVGWLPRGKRDSGGYVGVVQAMNRPGKYWDTIHNPILFSKTRRLYRNTESEWAAKNCHYSARKALKEILQERLAQMTRPMIRFCAQEVFSGSDGELYWQSFEPGASTDVLGRWREEVLYKLSCELGN